MCVKYASIGKSLGAEVISWKCRSWVGSCPEIYWRIGQKNWRTRWKIDRLRLIYRLWYLSPGMWQDGGFILALVFKIP